MHRSIQKGAAAVITGAARGLGFALATRLLKEGMDVVLLDSDGDALGEAARVLNRLATDGQCVVTVVGSATDPVARNALLDEASKLSGIGMLVNNAAVLKGAGPWADVAQWRTTMELNFWSILEMHQLFVPLLLAQARPSAIVNLGSKEGITTPPGNAAYNVSKAAIRVLTEQLAHELREAVGTKVSAHLFVPGYTATPMNFPAGTQGDDNAAHAWTADQAVDFFLRRLAENRFYILCGDNEVTRTLDERRMQWSADDMILNRPALSRWHPDFKDAYLAFIDGASQRPDKSASAYE